MTGRRRGRGERGAALIEFSLVAVQLFLVLFAIVEFSRIVLVATTVANSARAGVRYAIVHGGTRTGSGIDGPSGPGSTSEIESRVRFYAGAGLMNLSRLTVSVTYPDGSNLPGSRVSVGVVYAYDPFSILPLPVRLGSTTQGVIVF